MKLRMNSILPPQNPASRSSLLLALVFLGVTVTASLRAAPPVVSNIRASQRAGTQLVDILYDVTDPDSGTVSISVSMSSDGGAS